MPNVILHQFPYSHYNDKARWALSYKRIPYSQQSYLPGPHTMPIKKLSQQTQTPVLEWNGEAVAGSAAILGYLENEVPEFPLYPDDRDMKEVAIDWQNEADATLGPAVRTILFAELIHEPDYLCAMFSVNKNVLKRILYRRIFPLAKPLMAKGNGLLPVENIVQAEAITMSYLERISAASKETGYLAGSEFSVADLACAALIAPLCDVPCEDMKRPQPMPGRLAEFIEKWRTHPACEWSVEMYKRHRGPSSCEN